MSDKYFSPSGSPIKVLYTGKVLDDGTVELIESGKENFYDYIQSFKESVDIGVILKRAGLGDMSGLQRVQGFYGDVTAFPKTNAEILQLIMDSQKNFEQLPLEIKERFDGDFNKFFATMETKEWYEKMSMNNEKQSEVKTVESEQ